jgi:ABC-type nitrate/sulfonate/bicarbonate transport system substrate-binding protein
MDCDGADVDAVEFIDVGFDAFPALVNDRVDVAWVFLGWDAIQADSMGIELNAIPLSGSCVPDYYTPLIVSGESTIEANPGLLHRFMAATHRGYEYAIAHPQETAQILVKASPETDPELARRSQIWLAPHYQGDASRWGEQQEHVWKDLADFMLAHELIPKAVEVSRAFTNEFLP